MHNNISLARDLAAMGFESTDVVMVHSSMKSIGCVDGGADTVLNVLTDYFSAGAIAMPTLTWELMLETDSQKRIFDVMNTPTSTGLLPEMLRKRPGVLRSLHPTHSVAVYGQKAQALIEKSHLAASSCGIYSPWHQLYEHDGKIMMLGCKLTSCTFIHGIEEWGDHPCSLSNPLSYRIIPESGIPFEMNVSRHSVAGTSLNFGKIEDRLLNAGILTYGTFGDASVLLMNARPLYDFVNMLISQENDIFLHP